MRRGYYIIHRIRILFIILLKKHENKTQKDINKIEEIIYAI